MSYARGTIAALVDAVVPETPGADDETQVPGGLDIDLDETVESAFNELQEAPEGPIRSLGYETMPFAPLLALLLDFGALELILRRGREEPLQSPKEGFAGGPFSRLGPEDRMRAIRLLEADGVFPALDERYDAPIGIVAYLMQGAMFITIMAAYSDWGDDSEQPQGWEQVGYPGPADGYAVHMGYEVEEFEENDYGAAEEADGAVATDEDEEDVDAAEAGDDDDAGGAVEAGRNGNGNEDADAIEIGGNGGEAVETDDAGEAEETRDVADSGDEEVDDESGEAVEADDADSGPGDEAGGRTEREDADAVEADASESDEEDEEDDDWFEDQLEATDDGGDGR